MNWQRGTPQHNTLQRYLVTREAPDGTRYLSLARFDGSQWWVNNSHATRIDDVVSWCVVHPDDTEYAEDRDPAEMLGKAIVERLNEAFGVVKQHDQYRDELEQHFDEVKARIRGKISGRKL